MNLFLLFSKHWPLLKYVTIKHTGNRFLPCKLLWLWTTTVNSVFNLLTDLCSRHHRCNQAVQLFSDRHPSPINTVLLLYKITHLRCQTLQQQAPLWIWESKINNKVTTEKETVSTIKNKTVIGLLTVLLYEHPKL